MYEIQDYFTGETYESADTFEKAKAISDILLKSTLLGTQVVFEGEIIYTNIELPF